MTPAARRIDTELAYAVGEAFRLDVRVPDGKITADVADGWLTLDGDVEWEFQRTAAADAARRVAGMRGITNNISVTPNRLSAYDVSQSITKALEQRADRTAEDIVVSTNGNIITLTGKVSSFADRRAAEAAAWSVPGVTKVRDELAVVG